MLVGIFFLVFTVLGNAEPVPSYEAAKHSSELVTNVLTSLQTAANQIDIMFAKRFVFSGSSIHEQRLRLAMHTISVSNLWVTSIRILSSDEFVGLCVAENWLLTTAQVGNTTVCAGVPNTTLCVQKFSTTQNAHPLNFVSSTLVDKFELAFVTLENNSTTQWQVVTDPSQHTNPDLFPCSCRIVEFVQNLHDAQGRVFGQVAVGISLAALDALLSTTFAHQAAVVVDKGSDNALVASSTSAGCSLQQNSDTAKGNVTTLQQCSVEVATLSEMVLSRTYDSNKAAAFDFRSYATGISLQQAGLNWLVIVVNAAEANLLAVTISTHEFQALWVVAAVLNFTSLALLAWVIQFRHLHIWRVAQPQLLILFLVSNLACASCTFVFIGPPSDALCIGRQWALILATSLLGGTLIAKLSVVSDTLGHHTWCSTKYGFLLFALIMGIQIIVLSLWTKLDPPRPVIRYHANSHAVEYSYICAAQKLWGIIATRGMLVITIVSASLLAFRLRQVDCEFGEAKAFTRVGVHGAVLVILLVTIYFVGNITYKEGILELVVGLLWFTISSQCVVFLPRLYRQITLGDYSEQELKRMVAQRLQKLQKRSTPSIHGGSARVLYGPATQQQSGNSATGWRQSVRRFVV